MASDDWVHYKCQTGNTFFIHNKHTGEYRWLTEVNGPQLTPVKYSTIATQTDDYQCSNGCSSIYVSTNLYIQSSNSDNFYQATPENTIHHHGNIQKNQGTCHILSNSNLESPHFGKDKLPNQSHTFDKLNPENPIHYYGKDKLPDQSHAFDKSNPQNPVYHYNENKLDQGLVYNNKSHESDQESTLYSEYFTRRSSCFDEIPSMVKVFDRGMHSQSVTTETVTDNIHVDVANDDDECNGDNDGNGNDCKTNETKCYNESVDNLSKAKKISFATNININNEKLGVIGRVDSVTMPDHESLFPKDTEHELASSKLWQEESQSMENIPVIEISQSSHDKSHSSIVTVTVNSQAQPQSTISRGQRKAKFQCPICKRLFSQQINLNRHLHAHANENKLHDCSYCSKKFKHKRYLKFHMRTHTNDKPYACHLCDKRFTLKGTLKDHVERHAGTRPFKCNLCERTYTRKAHLNEHMRRHNGTAKVLPCSYCGKTFSVQSDLNMHIRIHTGIKPHACTFCDMKFTHRGNLNRHLQTHTGEKPYECSYCKKSFARSTYLKTHMKTHLEKNQETSQDKKENQLYVPIKD